MSSDNEWTTLTTFLGGLAVAGGKLKETGTTHWPSPNLGTNETGFTALPGGSRFNYGTFDYIGRTPYWWTATKVDAMTAHHRFLGGNEVGGSNGFKEDGFSIRCLRD